MIPDLGLTSLIAALVLCLLQSISFKKLDYSFAIFLAIITSFLSLAYCYITSDFSVLNVFQNSHQSKPLFYKISGIWGNHEGSMLLFALIFSSFTLFFSRSGKTPLKTKIIITQAMILGGLLSYILFTSSPFTRIFPAPHYGMGLNPLLQDVGLALHPPILYLGYTGFSLAFSFAIAGLLEKNIGSKWAAELRKWVIVPWAFLTIGIGIGSWWAYRELGWGGFWFWDPVENSSLLPWLTATALIHSLIVLERKNIFGNWSVILAIMTFSLSLLGFFLVRSGVLSSVHTFASDPYRGIFMLILLGAVAGGGFTIYGLKSPKLSSPEFAKRTLGRSGKIDSPRVLPKKIGKTQGMTYGFFSRENSILLNNLFLLALCFTVFLGTLYPIFSEVLLGRSVSVGAPYFNSIFNPIAVMLAVASVFAPLLKWKNDKIFPALMKLKKSFAIAFFSAIAIGYKIEAAPLSYFAIFTGIWLITSLALQIKLHKPISYYAMIISHAGIGLMICSIALLATLEKDKEAMMKPGQKLEIPERNISLVFEGTKVMPVDNYLTMKGFFSVYKGNKKVSELVPEARIYPVSGSKTTESAIYTNLISDVYVVIGEDDEKNGLAVRVFIRPFMNMVWLSCFMIALGGFVSVVKKKGRK